MGRSKLSQFGPVWAAALLVSLAMGARADAQDLYGPVAAQTTGETATIQTQTPPAPAVAAPVNARESLPLGPAPKVAPGVQRADEVAPVKAPSSALRTIGGLAVVLGLIFVMRWAIVRGARRRGGLMGQLGAGGRAPSGLLEVLGRYPVGRGQTLSLLRLDRRVLLLSQSSSGFTTLAEVTSPDDVASILMKAADEEGVSMTHRFQKLLKGMERDPSLVEEVETVEVGLPRSRFARPIQRDFAPAERTGSVASVRRRLSAMREGGA